MSLFLYPLKSRKELRMNIFTDPACLQIIAIYVAGMIAMGFSVSAVFDCVAVLDRMLLEAKQHD